MILVVNVCRERLHFYEFVKPVLDILSNEEVLCVHCSDLGSKDLEMCDKVIICGTSLKDDDYLGNLAPQSGMTLLAPKFDWLKDFDKPVLGICAGFQILGLVFGGKLKKKTEIGFFKERFDRDFLGLEGEIEVYHLHGNMLEFSSDWEVSCGDDFAQAVRWKKFYGVLFHPEVRNKEMILKFAGL